MRTAFWGGSLLVVTAACGGGAGGDDLGSRTEALSLVTKLGSPKTEQGAFGWAVSLSGTRLLVGDPGFGNSPNAKRGAAWVFELGSGGWAYKDTLTPLDGPASNNALGRSVGLSGDIAAVVESGDMEAHVFAHSGGAWAQQAGISITSFQDYSIAASGDTVAIGKANEWTGTAYTGAVRVHRQSGTTWPEEQKLTPSDAGASNFGFEVALDGNTLLVGAPAGGSVPGMAFVYVRSGSTWTEQGKLQPGPPELGQFGCAVALHGDTAVVGQYSLGSSAWVYVRSGTTWSLQAKLASPVTSNSYFGKAVGVSGDRVIVGAPLANGTGTAYLYLRTGTTWGSPTPINAADGVANDWFGAAVAIDGTRAAVGAPYHGGIGPSGAVYTYDVTTTGSGGTGGAGGTGGTTSGGSGGSTSGGGSGGSGATTSGGGSGGSTSSGGASAGGNAGSGGATSSGGASSGGASSGGASSGGTSTGGTSSGGASSGGGSAGAPASSSDDGGCGCRAGDRSAPMRGALWLALALAALRRRRANGDARAKWAARHS